MEHEHDWKRTFELRQESGNCIEVAAVWTCACQAAWSVEMLCQSTPGVYEESLNPLEAIEGLESGAPGDLAGVMDNLTADGVQRFLNTARKT